jgi:hypothetical protein
VGRRDNPKLTERRHGGPKRQPDARDDEGLRDRIELAKGNKKAWHRIGNIPDSIVKTCEPKENGEMSRTPTETL